jgi:hypothetical protein
VGLSTTTRPDPSHRGMASAVREQLDLQIRGAISMGA